MRYFLAISICCLIQIAGFAQQDPMFTQYLYSNSIFINPASAGRSGFWRGAATYRAQWAGLEGAPRTPALVLEGPLQAGRAGAGLSLFLDRIGMERHTGVYFNYAYRFPTGNRSYLSVGLRGGLSFYNTDFSQLHTPDLGTTDPVYENEGSLAVPRFGAGLFWHNERAYAGLSMPVFAAVIPEGGFSFSEDEAYLSRHFYFSAGYVFDLAGEAYQVKPFVFLGYHPAAPLQVQLCAQFWIADLLTAGVSYRLGDSFGFMAEAPIGRRFTIGYAYDLTASAFSPYAQGAHEFMVSYTIVPDDTKVPSIHKMPSMMRF